MYDPWTKLLLGLGTGFVFGFLLQKGQVSKFQVIIRQFLLRDFTVLKVMLTAIVVGGLGVYLLKEFGWATLHVKTAALGGVIGGGLIFGAGMAVLGYCPGTAVVAIAEGSRHAIAGLIGMMVGAAIYIESYDYLSRTLLAVADYGKVTWPEVIGGSPWIYLGIGTVVAVILFAIIERHERGQAGSV